MEQHLRGLGGFLQLVGVGIVAWELHIAIAKYRRRPTILDRLEAVYYRVKSSLGLARTRPVGKSVSAVWSIEAAQTLDDTLRREPANLTIRERIDELFRRVDDLNEQLERTDSKIASLRDKHTRDMNALRARVTDVSDRIDRTAEAIETGDVRVRTAGFLCVAFGIVFATWAAELGRWGFPLALAWAMSVFFTLLLTEFD